MRRAGFCEEQLDLILGDDEGLTADARATRELGSPSRGPAPWRPAAPRVGFERPRPSRAPADCEVTEWDLCEPGQERARASLADAAPAQLPPDHMLVVNALGELRLVPRGWTPEDREREFTRVLSRFVGQPVELDPCTTIADPGSLRAVRGPLPVLVRMTGGVTDPQDRACMIITAEHHRGLLAHLARGGAAYQVCVTRADPPCPLDQPTVGHLLTIAIPYERLAPIIDRKLQAKPSRHRINVGLFVQRGPTGPRLLLSGGGGLDLTEYAGMSELTALLRTGQLDPWARIQAHRTWLGMTAAVLTRREGLTCTVSHLDARKLVDQQPMYAVGATRLVPHRLPRVRGQNASVETLLRTDVIGARDARPLLEARDQPIVLCEVEMTTCDPIEKLARRVLAAEALGLTVGKCLVVAEERRLPLFARRLPILRPELARRIRMISTREIYHSYTTLADAHALCLSDEEQRTS
jgi:hypothetical protein